MLKKAKIHKIQPHSPKIINVDNTEITYDGINVWVNANDGMCIGRFGRRAVDVHANSASQLAGEHCKDCFGYQEKDRKEAWDKFCVSMKTHHNVTIPNHILTI